MARNHPIYPHFTVFEGLDGSGTTTQAQFLTERFRAAGRSCIATQEPTSGPTGTCVRSVLAGTHQVTAGTTAYLFAADRYEHLYGQEGILAHLECGTPVICDRYVFSSLAYQGISCGLDFVLRLNQDFPFPARVFFLDLPVSECVKRLDSREAREIYESEQALLQIAEGYRQAMQVAREAGVSVHVLDATRPREQLAADVWNQIDGTVPE